MIYLYVFTGLALLVSFLADRKKTCGAVHIAFKRFAAIAPAFLTMAAGTAQVFFFLAYHISACRA